MSHYNADSIETLEFRDAIRKRVGMYLGSDDNNGVLQAIREIVTNSIDEFTMGYGDKIDVTIKGDEVTVRDYARGVPFGARKDGIDSMIAIYTLPHSGGKFSDKTYQNVAGLNGTGAKATALSADQFLAISYRDGVSAELELDKGIVKRFENKPTKEKNGTLVRFVPSQGVFKLEKIDISEEDMKSMLETWSYLSKGLRINLNYNGKKYSFYNKNGIIDFVKDNSKQPVHKQVLTKLVEENGTQVEVAFQWNKDRSERMHVFTNGLENKEGGTPVTGARTALTRTINHLVGAKLSGESVRKGLTMAINVKIQNPSFSDQTKTKVSNPELRGLTDKAISDTIKEFSESSPSDWDKLVEVLVKEEKAEKAAEEARQKILNAEKDLALKSARRTNMDLPSKIVDATNKTGYRELYLSEGNSASAYLISTRDAATQGVMPLRGKILNTFDLEFHEAYENEEVKAIFTLMGSGAGSKYNASKLRYDKIIIASDMDPDGSHISLLLVALFLKHAPQLVKDGKLYRVISPFYGIIKGNKEVFLYSEEEFVEYEKKHGKQSNIRRYKGLGALTEKLTEEHLMDPEKRKLIQIKPEDFPNFVDLFEVLMGGEIEKRRSLVRNGELIDE